MSYLGATPKAPPKRAEQWARRGETSWGHLGERLRDVRHRQSQGRREGPPESR